MPHNGCSNCKNMESLSYNIGGLHIRFSGSRSLSWLQQSDAFSPFYIKETTPCNHHIYLDELGLTAQAAIDTASSFIPIHTFTLQDGTPCRWGKTGNSYLFEMDTPEQAMRIRMEDGHNAYATEFHSPFHLTFGIWMVFNYFTATMQQVCIHSSCISLHGKSILFLGESGSGKSTQSRLWQQCFPETELLNDDGPVLSAVDGRYHAFGSPWSGKTACYKQMHAPVTAFVKVVQAQENRISPLPVAAAVATLLAAFPPALCREQKYSELYLDLISGLLRQSTVYRLECRPDEAAALLCHRTISETT